MTISFWIDGHKEKPTEELDVAIVGGGIIGAAAAYWLSQRGTKLKTAVFEAQEPAAGASGRNGGFILRGIFAYYNEAVRKYGRDKAKWIFQFNEETQRHLSQFVEKHGNSFDYDRSGSYLLACSLDELQTLEDSATLMLEDGFEVEYIKQDPVERDFYGALYNACDVGVHPALLVKALLDASAVPVFNGEAIYRIESAGKDSLILHTTNKVVKCARVLLCTNAYTPLFEPWFAGKLQAVRGQILVTKPLRKRILDRLCYANYGWEYFRQLPDQRLLLGGCREPFRNEEVGYADMLTLPVQNALINYLKDRFPDAAGVPIDFRWSGMMSFTADGLPMLGELKQNLPLPPATHHSGIPGLFFAVGCNGHGMGYSLALSKLLIEVALDGADPGIFSAERPGLVEQPAPGKKATGEFRAEELVGP